jgi:hypothetical protein
VRFHVVAQITQAEDYLADAMVPQQDQLVVDERPAGYLN